MIRHLPKSLMVTAALIMALAAATSANAERYAVRGVVDAVKSHISVFINGQEVVHEGILDLSTRPLGRGTFGETDVFPFEGTYQGKPVEVRCYNTPGTSDIYCQVLLSGRLIKTLTFYQPSADGSYRAR